MTRLLLMASTMYHHAGRPPFHFSPNAPAAPPEMLAACALANAVAASIALYGFLPGPLPR